MLDKIALIRRYLMLAVFVVYVIKQVFDLQELLQPVTGTLMAALLVVLVVELFADFRPGGRGDEL